MSRSLRIDCIDTSEMRFSRFSRFRSCGIYWFAGFREECDEKSGSSTDLEGAEERARKRERTRLKIMYFGVTDVQCSITFDSSRCRALKVATEQRILPLSTRES
jgi:hypothetical protein